MMPLLKTNLPLNSLIQNGQVRTGFPLLFIPYNSHHFVEYFTEYSISQTCTSGMEAKYVYAETQKNGGMGVLRQRRIYSFA